MPLTLVNKEVEVVECTKVRGLVQITRDGEMWNCRAVVYNSNVGTSSTSMSSDKVVELFKAVGVPQPVDAADSHCVEFFDGPEASVWESFGFDPNKFPANVAEVV